MATRARFDKDYYRIMGLPAEATEEEIRRAYRRLALEWHPDRNPGRVEAAERFKEISEAYAVLIDPAKRREYDRVRRGGFAEEFHVDREQIFRDLFADPRASAIFTEIARELGRMGFRVDHRSFHQTLGGGRTVISGHIVIITPFHAVLGLARLARAALRGARAASVAGARAAGQVDARPAPALPPAAGILGALGRIGRWLLGLPPAGMPGLDPADLVQPLRLTAAEAARGGRQRVRLEGGEELLVTVPAGVRPGTRLRLRGKGRARPGGGRGDAYLTIEVER